MDVKSKSFGSPNQVYIIYEGKKHIYETKSSYMFFQNIYDGFPSYMFC